MNDVQPPQQQKPSIAPSPTSSKPGDRPVNAVPIAKPNPATQPATKKSSGGIGKWLFGALVVVLFGILMSMLWVKWSEADSVRKELTSTQDQLNSTQSELAKLQAGVEANKEEDVATTSDKTIQQLTSDLLASYKTGFADKAYVAQSTKTKGDFVSVVVSKPNTAGSRETIYKKVGNELIAIATFGPTGLTAEEKATLKTIYGFDASTY